MLKQGFVIFLGGGLGALLRWRLSTFNADAFMPVGTLVANVLGCLVLGVVLGSLRPGSLVFLFLVAGFCGALTTFSTLTLEWVDARSTWSAMVYGVVSIAAGVGALLLGLRMGRWLS